jgi:hypothetical protein
VEPAHAFQLLVETADRSLSGLATAGRLVQGLTQPLAVCVVDVGPGQAAPQLLADRLLDPWCPDPLGVARMSDGRAAERLRRDWWQA